MTMGMSTRAVGGPMGTHGQNAGGQPGIVAVPLSVFFLNMQGDGDEDNGSGLYGRRKKAKSKKDAKSVKKDVKNAPVAASGQTSAEKPRGGGAEQAHAAGQSSASESVTMATGTPLVAPGGSTRAASWPGGPSKLGATRATTGATSSGNVAQYPKPFGAMLRRESPVGEPKRRRRRTKEERAHWIERLLK